MRNYILFDFDGTVFDTAEGITKCVQYALGKMGISAELDELMCFAGPPLVEMFMQKYGMSEKDALHATELYRERYLPIGWAKASGGRQKARSCNKQARALSEADIGALQHDR